MRAALALAAEHVAIAERFVPRAAHRRTYDRLFDEFREVYRRTRAIHARLHRDAEPRRSP